MARIIGIEKDCIRLNAQDGVIASGHPISIGGVRLATTAVHPLGRRGERRALCIFRIGVDPGIPLTPERVD
jgi:acetyl-CoA C-acetyltransferase